MISPSSTLSHGHRRQISTPGFEATRPVISNMPPHRTHRRGQTVDYGSFGPQAAVGRRSATSKVTQLRDYFNEKSGFSRQAMAAQQFMPASHDMRFVQSGLPLSQTEQYQAAYMWNPEELQDMYTVSGSSATFPSQVAPALERSASDNPNTKQRSRSQDAHQQHPQLQQQKRWESFSQQPQSYPRSLQQLSVHPEAIAPKINPYVSYNASPITPDATPMKSSFDLSMYTNDHTPTKSQSFSFPRTPITAEIQRANSIQGLPISSPMPMTHQMPSPATSVADFAELAAMPSPGPGGMSSDQISAPSTPSSGMHTARDMSPASSNGKSMHDMHAETVDEFDLDARVKASLKESSVSSDEIAQYISGPDPKDNKWVCLFRDCRCRFGRKENIKSHVQTHLNDRQYVCDRCGKDFVRGHDLKRHLKTHSGKKPFACACGASFARQDALTRHRQRDMCVGGFTGFVPKTTKRGRPPKKNRPDIESRQVKSTRTRQRVAEKSMSVSSVTPIKVENTMLQEPPMFNSPDYAPSSSMSSFTPPTSPGGGYDHQSPVQSGPSISSQQFEDDMLPLPLSPPQLAHNRYARAMEQFEGNNSGESSQDCLYSDPALSPYDMSSPHTAPTLAESSVGSEIDVFISQDPTDRMKEEFDQMKEFEFMTSQSSNLPSSYAYVDTADFGITSSIYSEVPGKTISGLSALEMDPYADQIDSFSSEFLVDP